MKAMNIAHNQHIKKKHLFQQKKMAALSAGISLSGFCVVFVVFPVLFCFFLTFHKWNIISPMHFIGTDNYIRLFHDRLFWKAIGNTLNFYRCIFLYNWSFLYSLRSYSIKK